MLTSFLTSVGTTWGIADKAYFTVLLHAVNIILILLLAFVVVQLSKRALRRIRARKAAGASVSDKTLTLMTLSMSVVKYAVYFLAFAAVLSELGLGVTAGSLLATAGIGGLAIGFGAQNLIRDVVTGFFMLFENQFTVGDYIVTPVAEGTVESLTLRTTILRGARGEKIIIPNGNISMITNYSRGDYTALIEVSIARDQDIERVIRLMEHAVKEALNGNKAVREVPKVLGVSSMSQNEAVVRATCTVQGTEHWAIERIMRKAVLQTLSAHGVRMPYQQTEMLRTDAERS